MSLRDDSESLKQLNMAKNFLELSSNQESCVSLRSSGCIQILVQILHSSSTNGSGVDDDNEELIRTRQYASQALQNIVHSNPIEKDRRREVKILRLLDQILEYSSFLKTLLRSGGEAIADDEDRHPLAAISLLMKASFDEENRITMCELGALKAIPNLVHLDHAVHGPLTGAAKCCNSLRRYALMALTNLTFGDENNKAYLCGQKQFMEVVIALLDAAPDDLLQVVASVLRNLSWRADKNMKTIFNEVGAVTALAQAAMRYNKNENTLKAILSALWNLSAHCSTNKAEFCAVNGSLAFLVKMLIYEGPSKTLKIVENAGGILRNVSSHIAVCEPYRQILREHNCLSILLQHLKSDNVAVVTNACGTLWNLSARCPRDQKYLLDHGAVPLLRALGNSKNTMIVEGSASALKNLINFRDAIEAHQDQEQTSTTVDLKSNSDTLKRRFSAVMSTNCNHQQQQQQQSLHTIGSTASLPRSMVSQTCKSPNSVYSAKSDTAAMQHKPLQVSNFSETLSLSRPETRQLTTAEVAEEQPIDYSMKYNEHEQKRKTLSTYLPKEEDTHSFYQETDLDQPTNFSIRYLEDEPKSKSAATTTTAAARSNEEILLILDDGLKPFQQTEVQVEVHGTRKLLKAASATELRACKSCTGNSMSNATRSQGVENLAPAGKYPRADGGSHTPERPTHYCEEGTPGYFSRYDSLNSVVNINHNETLVAPQQQQHDEPTNTETTTEAQQHQQQQHVTNERQKKSVTDDQKQAAMSMLSSAMETPLMFSRRSSMDSLVNEDVGQCDDNTSVTSEYSRMQSGVISPIPDSPTQSMPQFVRLQQQSVASATGAIPAEVITSERDSAPDKRKPICSVFEDDISTFHVENTPAQFSCATSLSNMSILDDESNLGLIEKSKNLNNEKDNQKDTTVIITDNNISTSSTSTVHGVVKESFAYTQSQYQKVCSGMNSLQLEPKPDIVRKPPTHEDAISKMRRGGPAALPGYLPVTDEMNKYGVENSPCNYSVISGLSNLTIGSEFAGPARTLKENKLETQAKREEKPPALPQRNLKPPQRTQNLNDSLSSLSMDSDDDGHLLSQAIAAGSNRQNVKGNNTTLSKTTPMPDTASLPKTTKRSDATKSSTEHEPRQMIANPDYCSSTDSDSFDDISQSKSLFEQCILSGMHKSSDALSEVPRERYQTVAQHSRNNNGSTNNLTIASSSESNNNRRQMKLYATLSPPRRRQARAQQQDKRLLNECISTGIPQKRTGCDGNSNISSRDAQENCVSNQVRHFEQIMANTNTAQSLKMSSSMTSSRRELTRNGNVQHWV